MGLQKYNIYGKGVMEVRLLLRDVRYGSAGKPARVGVRVRPGEGHVHDVRRFSRVGEQGRREVFRLHGEGHGQRTEMALFGMDFKIKTI